LEGTSSRVPLKILYVESENWSEIRSGNVKFSTVEFDRKSTFPETLNCHYIYLKKARKLVFDFFETSEPPLSNKNKISINYRLKIFLERFKNFQIFDVLPNFQIFDFWSNSAKIWPELGINGCRMHVTTLAKMLSKFIWALYIPFNRFINIITLWYLILKKKKNHFTQFSLK
jgi:hypothetical protein